MPADGLLVVDKPAGWTSHDVVAKARWVCGTRKVGHAGTLDPMATGVLLLGVGRATRLLTYLVGCDKGYDATVRLGQATVTDDAEGEVTVARDASGVTREALDAAVARLTGEIQQVPSSVSAIKVDGKRSYARVRGGEEVALAARPVTVSTFEVRGVRAEGALIDVDVRVEVSSGTYVRALARDLGADLGVGGHLTALRRTRVGRFGVEDARPLDELVAGAEAAVAAGQERSAVVPLLSMGDAARAQFPERVLTEAEERSVRYGQRIDAVRRGEAVVAALDASGQLVALLDETRPQAKSLVVFPPD
ncbi:tRNA pseudouridine(55) synthase TruB [Lapillicoccus jejuensis]|uniref:tRNA pseudouridine synthase B n=1 Tax=Lapillicoccus jejuensis TaxID=402171 RepID=A0A542E3R0_9MICO|nr:tRNA pseudouridine(55) synthase TruB [Lapillicoccus jejuensis]TQJ09971.1 tRNA pseudouridine synthase B [Lapillicoccus jejuensis]